MTSYDIDSESLQAVKNLKSKFERLASGTSPSTDVARTGNGRLVVSPPGPRRSSSNSQLHDSSVSDAGHIRTSSSSSDFQALARRAPPPPPLKSNGSSAIISSPASSPARSAPTPPSRPELKDSDVLPRVYALRSKLWVRRFLIFSDTHTSTYQARRQFPYQISVGMSKWWPVIHHPYLHVQLQP